MNLTSVLGIPIFLSKPHYLHTDPRLVASIQGMQPAMELHDTYIDVEHITGVTMREALRLMFSTFLTDWSMGAARPTPNKGLHRDTPGDRNASSALHVALEMALNSSSTLHTALKSGLPAGFAKCLNPLKECAANGESWSWDIASEWPQGLFTPYAWVQEKEELTDQDAATYKGLVESTLNLADTLTAAGFSVAGVAAVLLLSTAVHQRKAGILGFDQERGQGSAQVHTDAITEDLTSLLDVREVGHGSAGL